MYTYQTLAVSVIIVILEESFSPFSLMLFNNSLLLGALSVTCTKLLFYCFLRP
jgi:hypothetical protein